MTLSDKWNKLNEGMHAPVRPPANALRLTPCPDCKKDVSWRAASCVHCGSVFKAHLTVVDGKNWVWRIAFGIILSGLILAALSFFFWIMIGAVLLGPK